MGMDGWGACEEDIFNVMKNAGPHEMTTGMLSFGPREDLAVEGRCRGWFETKDLVVIMGVMAVWRHDGVGWLGCL